MYRPVSTKDMHEKAPEVVVNQPGLEVLQYSDSASAPAPAPTSTAYKQNYVSSIGPIPAAPEQRPRKSQRIFNLSPFLSGLLVGIIIAIVLALAVGLGLGTALISCKRDDSNLRDQIANTKSYGSSTITMTASQTSSTPTATSTSDDLDDYAVPAATSISHLHNDCSSGTFTSIWQDQYSTDCNIDYVNGGSASQGGIVADIAGIFAYSFRDCLNACSGLNNRADQYGFPTKCFSISWGADMSLAIAQNYANCWLKNGTLADANDATSNSNVMSAKLIQ